jgi:hypothetical protein
MIPMSFIDTSITTAASLSKGSPTTGSTTASVAVLPATAKSVATSVSTTLNGVNNSVTQITAITKGIPNAAKTAETALISAGTSMLGSAIKSLTATFSGSKTALAGGISPSLAKLFTNTNNPNTSTIVTTTSDQVKTNLINGGVAASNGFTISSSQAGAQSLSVAGASSSNGSGLFGMTGTQLSTVINRFNLDSITQLPGAASNSLLSSKMNGLFSTLAVDAGSLVSSVAGNTGLGKLLASTTTAVVAGSLGLTKINNPANDRSLFSSSTSGLSSALSTSDFSSFYLTNPTTTLLDDNGNPVATNGSGVDVDTANAILSLIKLAGCDTPVTDYNSANHQASLFNLGLNLSAMNGMSDLVSNLLGCSHASTALGQQSLTTAFVSSAGVQPAVASSILGSISSKSPLNTDFIAKSIVTNPNLSAKDVGTVNGIFTQLGSTSLGAMTVPSVTPFAVPVYDLGTISQASPSFVDGVFGDTTMTDYLSSYEMKLQSDGSLSYV